VVLKLGRFGKLIRNTWKVLKRGAEQLWWKISWADRVRSEEVLQRVKDERNVLQAIKEGRLNGLINCCVGTVF
jgi:hypothetical protein